MIVDVTYLDGETTRYKTRSKASCRGYLVIGDKRVAHLISLAVLVSPSIVGGRFLLEWHIHPEPLDMATLSIWVEYRSLDGVKNIRIDDLSILEDGVILGVGNLVDLLGRDISFFAKRMDVRDYPLGEEVDTETL